MRNMGIDPFFLKKILKSSFIFNTVKISGSIKDWSSAPLYFVQIMINNSPIMLWMLLIS